MGIMSAWERWSQRQWDTWGKHLRPSYRRIQKWDFSDEVKAQLQSLADALPAVVRESLLKILHQLYTTVLKNYGQDFVNDILKKIKKFIDLVITATK